MEQALVLLVTTVWKYYVVRGNVTALANFRVPAFYRIILTSGTPALIT
ncbi:hypothetical protein SAMN05661099_3523 [Daejeonella lutea]|uniref:Uncharacterized protein n=1 Tax=Daejeonella lutea TaxID=572036 RepID=A0A1T5F8M5_9SPHI|nr:hypothetical protein SAMN05661099_3523 [Daejeonella lutea]